MSRASIPDEAVIDAVVEDLLSLLFIYFRYLLKNQQGITGFHAAEYRLLGYLMSGESVSMSALAKKMYLPLPHMTKLVDILTQDGLVIRQDKPGDRRVIQIHITDKGMNHLKTAQILYKNSVMELLSGFDQKDITTLGDSAAELMDILSQISE